MTSEADEAMENYRKYAEALAEEMGISIGDTETETEKVSELGTAIDNLPDVKKVVIDVATNLTNWLFGSHAIGSAYVPYDNYPALLHRGERVLTATEARQNDSGNVDYGALRREVTGAIREGMAGASVNSYLNGRDISTDVSRNNIRQLKARRFQQ